MQTTPLGQLQGQQALEGRMLPPYVVTRRQIRHGIFYLVFLLCFCLSGILSMASMVGLPIPYRMAFAALLVLPLFALQKIRITPVTVGFAVLVSIILLSGVRNHSSLKEIGLFLRIPFFAFLIYQLVQISVDSRFLLRVLRICVPLAIIQLPLLLLERLAYPYLPSGIRAEGALVDFDFGTFNFKGDSKMAYFLLMLIIFLLFNRYSYMVTRRRGLLAIWATLTILLANSEISKISVILVWGFYFLTKLNHKFTLRLLVGVAIFLLVFVLSGYATKVVVSLAGNLTTALNGLQGDPDAMQRYLQGTYSRGGAIYFYLHQPLSWVGDGPSRYSNPIDQTRLRGDVGHIFTFYSEIGLLGLLTSIAIFVLIIFDSRGWQLRINLQTLAMLGVLMIAIFTAQAMNDISIVLATCLFAVTWQLRNLDTRPRAVLGGAA